MSSPNHKDSLALQMSFQWRPLAVGRVCDPPSITCCAKGQVKDLPYLKPPPHDVLCLATF